MPCYSPIRAWRSKSLNPTGKRSLVFNRALALQPDDPLSIPCRQCIGCRLDKSVQWAARCVHESTLYPDNCFITLTYTDKYLPEGNSLDHSHFQKFMKKLRDRSNYVGSDGVNPIRYYMCGEYGSKNGRPHFHACLFNYSFTDKVLWKEPNGNRLYISKTLDELWSKGFSTVGDVTFESAAYIARYIVDKLNISSASSVSDRMRWAMKYVDWDTGLIRNPEYNQPSRRPGLAKVFFEKFSTDFFPHDYVVINGRKFKPPKYYDGLLEVTRPYEFDAIKERRQSLIKSAVDNNTFDRLYAREQVKLAQFNQLKRDKEF